MSGFLIGPSGIASAVVGPTTIFTAGSTPTNQVGDIPGYTFRNVIPITAGSAGRVRVTFVADPSVSGYATNNCSVGVFDTASLGTNESDTLATPVELLFSGAHGFTLSAGQSITSDWASLSFTSSNKLVVILDGKTGAGNGLIPQIAGVGYPTQFARFLSASASYNQQVFGGTSGNGNTYAITSIETGP